MNPGTYFSKKRSKEAEGGLWAWTAADAPAQSPLTWSPDGSPHSPQSSGPACLLSRTIPEGLPARPAWPVGMKGERRSRNYRLLKTKQVTGGSLRWENGGHWDSGIHPFLLHWPIRGAQQRWHRWAHHDSTSRNGLHPLLYSQWAKVSEKEES